MIDVRGEVALVVDGAPARLTAEGARVRVDAEEPQALLRSGSPRALRSLAAGAARVGVTVEVVTRGRTLIVLGAVARRGIVARLAGIEHASVPVSAVPTLVRARRAARVSAAQLSSA